ncbi:MAG TPA: spermidine/putrescine ABC transporter substrate-binding protein [Acidimicrobiia bacterium]|jgi:spermidine/putrescine transport system substrate-binding protein|nr:spermidine/putrescine ABC transporter substrate-binding protein [Acidimicrobiia bacterium]
MASHPRERRQSSLSRREFLRNSAFAGAALSVGGSAFLAACGSSGSKSGASGGTGKVGGCGQPPKLSRQNDPATLPLCSTAIKDGLDPETGATLKIFNYADYVGPDMVKAFEDKYHCKVSITTFDSMDDAVSKIQANTASFDITNISPDRIGSLVATENLQPINHSYIPNLTNVWPSLQSPFYDTGARYSVPYTLYTTGIGYRVDKIDAADDPFKLKDGTDLLYNPKYKGKVSVLDDDREALSMALLRLGNTNVNTEDAKEIKAAGAELNKLIDLVNVKVDIQDYTMLPEGSSWVHQAWGGDMINAVADLPKGVPASVLGYWFQPDGKGLIQNDMMAIPKNSKNPVLAHLFLNFFLDSTNALLNFNGIGYQQPLNDLPPESFISKGLVPENLKTALVKPSDFDHAFEELQLSPAGDRLWQAQWRQFTSGG